MRRSKLAASVETNGLGPGGWLVRVNSACHPIRVDEMRTVLGGPIPIIISNHLAKIPSGIGSPMKGHARREALSAIKRGSG